MKPDRIGDPPKPAGDIESLLPGAPKTKMPEKLQPMKATLVREAFDAPGWLYEIKWDGYRALAMIARNHAELFSRNNISFDQFHPIADALGKWNANAVIDAEIVVLGADGKSDFSAIQNWQRGRNCEGSSTSGSTSNGQTSVMSGSNAAIIYFCFFSDQPVPTLPI